MVNRYLLFEFVNNNDSDVVFIIDPPCVEYTVKSGQKLQLKVQEVNREESDNTPILTFRYEGKYTNIDINYSVPLFVILDGVEEKVW